MKSEFSELVQSEYSQLKNFALKLTRNTEDANDLVQETMLKAFKYRDKFKEGTNLKGWLGIIMKNIFINNYRRNAKHLVLTDDTAEQFYINSSSRSVINAGESNMIMREISKALSSLTDNLRIPFLMSFNGYKYQEIAEDLHIPLGTVKIRIHCARKKLQEKITL